MLSGVGRAAALAIAVAPYLALAGVDAVMHERDRRVPRAEQAFHALSAVTLVAFLVGVFRQVEWLAWAAFGVFALSTAVDEIRFHGPLPASERRVHLLSYGALGLFLVAWRWVERAP